MTDQIWDFLIEHDLATEEELRLITAINGMDEDSLNAVLYVRTGYHTIDQIEGE